MADLPRVLLLGDSIRMSYQAHVANMMEADAQVMGPLENCQYSAFTNDNLAGWIDELGTPQVVHWNNGLHDVGHNPAREPVQFPLDDYIGNLRAIYDQLVGTGATIIWATLTPIHPQRPFRDDGWGWKNSEIDQYNTAVLELINSFGIEVNDLHAVVSSDIERYFSEDMLHLSLDGQQACAEAVVKRVTAALG